jgi:nucleoside-diphosphate-sugar epimerase
MRVFMTGASGYIGSAVVEAFVAAGHEVMGLTHSPEKVRKLESLGATPIQGDIAKPLIWSEEAAGHDELIHLAFDYETPVDADFAAIDALLEVGRTTVGRNCHMIYTSGCWVLGETGDDPADEEAPLTHPAPIVAWRPAHEAQVLGSSDETFFTAVIRPGMVYGGHGGLVARLFESASTADAAEYIERGENRWSLVHRDDLARLYLAIAEERATGVFHGVDGTALRVADVAQAASRAAGAGGKTNSISLTEARQRLGPVADALLLDQVLGAKRSRELGWEPLRTSFSAAADDAFREWKAGGVRVREE